MDLNGARTELHALAMHLLDSYARAMISGSTEMRLDPANFLSMARVVMKGVMAIESMTGTPGGGSPPLTSGGNPVTSTQSTIDAFRETVRKQVEEIQKKTLEGLQEQLEKQRQEQSQQQNQPQPAL